MTAVSPLRRHNPGNVTGWQRVRLRLAPFVLVIISAAAWSAIFWGVKCL